MPQTLTPTIFTQEEVQNIFKQPDISTATGICDRAILEVLYAIGLRRSELAKLKMEHINFERNTFFVKEGKGKKIAMYLSEISEIDNLPISCFKKIRCQTSRAF